MYQLSRLSGAIALVAASLLVASASPSWALATPFANPSCTPDIATSSEALRQSDGAITGIDVTSRAETDAIPANRLASVRLSSAVNSRVYVNGQPMAVPTTITLASPQVWTFRAQRLDVNQPFQVDYVVRDQCGDLARFIGSGTGDGRAGGPVQDGPIPTATRTPVPTTVTPTLTPTRTPTFAVTATTTPAAAPNPADMVAPAPMRLTSTFNSIGVEAPITGDPNRNATAALRFHRVGDTSWRNGLDLWLTSDASGSAFYGSALLLEPGTAYVVRVTIADPDGVSGEAVQTATVTTRAETIAEPSSLTPGYFVRASGNDAADGRSAATAWKTIDKAIKDAPSGAIVQVGPGHYPTSRAVIGGWTYARSLPLTLIAQYPAVNGDHQPINAWQRSVIEPVGVSSPSGATDGPNPGVWRQVTLTGPQTGAAYTVWTWTGSPVTDATQLGYAATRAASPIRVAHWKKDSLDLATPAGWAEKVSTNLTYNTGFYANGQDLYLCLPGGLNPNTLYLTASNKNHTALAINGPDIRVSGFEIRQFTSGVEVMWGARTATVDHNLLTGNLTAVFFRAQGSTFGSDHVVQDNVIQDAGLWSTDQAAPAIPWMFIKSNIRNADGSDYPTSKIGANAESAGITGRGGAVRTVIRRNLIIGLFDGVRNGYNDGFNRYASQDMEVSDNVIRRIADDALEPEQAAINFRAWNNRFEETLTILSTGPVKFGPVYLFRNTAWRIGSAGTGADGQGRLPASAMLKYSGVSSPAARVYLLHNTFWTDIPNVSGGAQLASYGPNPERLWLRNNVIRSTLYAFDAPVTASWNEDANYFSTTHSARGLRYSGIIYAANVPAYRTASGQGTRTNTASGFTTDVSVVNPITADLRLPAGSPLIDAGVQVPNISDRPGIDFQGSAPDIGFEVR